MDSSRPRLRQAILALAAIGWASAGLAFLGRPADLRLRTASWVIPPQDPALAAAEPAGIPEVTIHSPGAWPGLNLITDGGAARVLLLDMDGRELHRWHRPLEELVDGGTERRTGLWARARLLPGGRLLVVVGGVGLVLLDRDSGVLWKAAKSAHDDLELLPDGRIVVLVRGPRPKQDLSRSRVIVEDGIALLEPDGRVVRSLSLVDALLDSPFDQWRVDPLEGYILDTAAMAWLPAGSPLGRGLLLSMRRPKILSVLDPATEGITWSKGGDLGAISDLEILPDGGLLVVETEEGTDRSRAVERDPLTLEARWSRELRSRSGGLARRLPNGDTLITASDDGSTVEISPDGTVVWALGPSPIGSASAPTPYETERIDASLWEGP